MISVKLASWWLSDLVSMSDVQTVKYDISCHFIIIMVVIIVIMKYLFKA